MPESILATVVARVRWRWRLRSLAWAVAIGAAVFAFVLVVAIVLLGASQTTGWWWAVFAGAGAALWLATVQWRLSALDAATTIERATGSLDNLVVTAAELREQPRPVRAEIRDEIDRQAAERLRSVHVNRVVPLAQPVTMAMVMFAGCVLLHGIGGSKGLESRTPIEGSNGAAPIGPANFRVTVSPPRYLRRNEEVFDAPVQISVIAGSRVRIATAATTVRDWVPAASEGIEIRPDSHAEPRFLSLIVVPDAPPQLRVVAPGKDLALAKASGTIAINVETRDDLGLAALSLRFTKASGGGENVAFTEGDAPLTIERRGDRQWTGRATLALETLGLGDGDILVYRAIARDINPQGTPVQSDQYLIEIGKNSEIADAGFALPSEEKKYAISQQMVIYKTEQLLKSKTLNTGSDPNFNIEGSRLTEARNIAIEQRMVRAEVVFLGGGEVQDELEEAAQSNELTEGRLQNTGRAEMLLAINAMSRAEAQLNDGRAAEALVFEKQALASLERALDRRRYFLRTLPDRSRIDVGRRLTGPRADARSWLRDDAVTAAPPAIAAARGVMRELASGANVDAGLAARVAAIDPAAPELQKAAVGIASASTDSARHAAVEAAMQAVTAHALKVLASSAAIGLRADPHAGALADEMRKSVKP